MVKANRKYGFAPDYAIPPGETLIDLMESIVLPFIRSESTFE